MCGLYSFSKKTYQYKPQYAFKMSMFMCPAVHINSRSLLRSSSTHEPSDPPLRVLLLYNFTFFIMIFIHISLRVDTNEINKIKYIYPYITTQM